MTPRPLHLALLMLSTSVAAAFGACVDNDPDSDQLADDVQTQQTCPVSGTDITKSLIVTSATSGPDSSLDAAGVQLFQQKFAFTRTLDQILATSGADPSETGKTLFQQWMTTFGPTDCTAKRVGSNSYGEVCPRTPEFGLAATDPTDPKSAVQYVPVAVTNRFDLAPKSGANCGEFRIVYTMPANPEIGGVSFLIFEGALPNPNPTAKARGCLPVAEWWQNLSNDPDETSRLDKLEKFYYLGTAIKGVAPVVDAHHYGFTQDGGAYTAGQIRTNMLVGGVQWNLREFKTDTTCAGGSCTLALDHVVVATNPADEVFKGTALKSPQFLAAFPKQVAALASADLSTIGMTIADQYDEYESVSQNKFDVLYDRFTDADLTSAIGSAAAGTGLTTAQVLRRASTQTCAGCHQLSTTGTGSGDGTGENQLGNGMVWPASNGFTQITQFGNTSPALQDVFLPHRKAVLESYINALCGPGSAGLADDGLTVGGSQVGAAN